MKDLKHLIYFEDLLQEANNDLIRQAQNEGMKCIGYMCENVPEPLLNLPGCFSSRLRAPRCTSTDIAGYYMTNRSCPYARSILERAIEGGYNYLDALFGAESCATMDRMETHFTLLHPVKNDRFFVTHVDPPMKGDRTNLDYYKVQLRVKVLEPLKERLGVDVSEEAMRTAVEKHNRLCGVMTEIGNFRKLPNPPITGYEFHVMQLVSQVCPHDLILPYLEETLEELKKMECSVRILYMDADVPTLVRRYKESRRPHPLAEPGMTTEQAVQREEELLAWVKARAERISASKAITVMWLDTLMISTRRSLKTS